VNGFPDGVTIGDAVIGGVIFLAPMAGVTDLPFRRACKRCGAALTYTEMVSAKALSYGNAKTAEYLRTDGEDGPKALQLFGSDPGVLSEVAATYGGAFDLIDLNMGCPAPKIIKNGEGAALMRDPKLIGDIIKKVVARSKKPVTVKFRKGYDQNSPGAEYAAQVSEANGASAVTVHGRYANEYYSGTADLEIIKRVKRAVAIPVIGNGDIKTPADAQRMFEVTNCDAVMVGRAARGDPWLFERITANLRSEREPDAPGREQKIVAAMRHARELTALKGERVALNEMRKHFAWYLKGVMNSAELKVLIFNAGSFGEIEAALGAHPF